VAKEKKATLQAGAEATLHSYSCERQKRDIKIFAFSV
jgi:hypothetical protein